jgi:hypothetical protein
MKTDSTSCVAFHGKELLAHGSLADAVRAAKALVDRDDPSGILFFDAITSELVEVDLRGTLDEVLGRLAAPTPPPAGDGETEESHAVRLPGRPRLGVVPREVTLLPRHWEWLASRPGGASVTLRRLVEAARKAGAEEDARRAARESAFRFMNAMAGDEAGFEEACRALFAEAPDRFADAVASWPPGIRSHALDLAKRSFPESGASPA